MIRRPRHASRIRELLRQFPVVGLLGARQTGKTTLARSLAAGASWFDLENPFDLARLAEPMLSLPPLRGLVVIDEVQRMPSLFPILRVLADREGDPARFLLLGSASPDLLRQSAESLAGRIAYHSIGGFGLDEVDHAPVLWLRGGFPRSFLAASDTDSFRWREAFIATFLERDLAALGVGTPAPALRRFWTMLAHYHGQTWNSSELARAFGVSDKTVNRYLDDLSQTFMAWSLAPWHENLAKRQVKAPKVYLRDSGLLHALLGIASMAELEGHPKVGASWEGFALGEVLLRTGAAPHECFYWATHGGAELDLLIVRGRERRGFEFKRTASPARTRSMAVALEDLRLDSLDVVYPGDATFPLGERIRAVGFGRLEDVGGVR